MADPVDNDVLFSLQRWFGMLLPAPWDIQPTRVEPQERPAGTVQPMGPEGNSGSAYLRDLTQTYEVFLWPLGVENEPLESQAQAYSLKTLVKSALTQGFVTTTGYRAYSLRVPWYSYDGMALTQDYPDDASPEGYLVLTRNFSIDVRKDPEQDDLFTLVISVTVETRQQGDSRRFGGAVLQDVTTSFTPPPPP